MGASQFHEANGSLVRASPDAAIPCTFITPPQGASTYGPRGSAQRNPIAKTNLASEGKSRRSSQGEEF